MTTEGEPMSGETQDVGLSEQEREAMDRASSVFGWQHLARYSGMSSEWLNRTLAAMVRSALAARVAAERERANTAAADAWDEGHRGLCRRHGLAPFAACRNPYRAALDTPREDQP